MCHPDSGVSVSLGARYEWQGNLNDSNNIDPRFGFAYQIGSNTVLRGGSGTFHQRMQFFLVTDLIRNDGTNQKIFEVTESSFPVPSVGEGAEVPTTTRVRAPELTAPYTWNMVETATGEAEAAEISGCPRTTTIWIRSGDAPAHGMR